MAPALVLWIWVPRWAPEWVIERSPFVTPIIRAVLVEAEARTDEKFDFRHENRFRQRMRDWGPGVIPSLVRGLVSPEPWYREACLCGIGAIAGRNTLDASACEAVVQCARADENPWVRVRAVNALQWQHNPTVNQARREILHDPDWRVRAQVVVAGLDPRQDDQDSDALRAALRDPDWRVRNLATWQCLKMKDARAIPDLIRVMVADGEIRPRSGAIAALKGLQATEALPALQTVMDDKRGDLGISALSAICEIDPAHALGVLKAALAHEERKIRRFAVYHLGKHKDARAREILVRLASDRDPLMAGLAMIQLGKQGAGGTIDLVLARVIALDEFRTLAREEAILVPNNTPIAYIRFEFDEFIDTIDALPMSGEQRQRWEALLDQ